MNKKTDLIRSAKSKHGITTILGSLLLVICSACSVYNSSAQQSYYYLNPNRDLAEIGRVVLLEFNNNSNYPQISSDVTKALFYAIQKKQLLGLSVVYQDDPVWQNLELNSVKTLSLQQLSSLRKTLQTRAVLIGTVTEYRPYPHMIIGLSLKLIDLTDGEMLWAVEQIWDSTDKTTQNRIKKYYSKSDAASLRQQLGRTSPLMFTKFVTDEVAQTLEP